MPTSPPSHDPVLAQLIAAYSVFRDAQPLAIGIHKAIMAAHPEIDIGALRIVLKRHTSSTKYLKSVASGRARYGLDGLPAGEITWEQQAQASQTIKGRFRKQAEQRREALKAQEHQARLQLLVNRFKP